MKNKDTQQAPRVDPKLWEGSFNGRENTLQQLAPYIGKLKTGMANALIDQFTSPGDVVYDPFSGSGVVPFESALLGRTAWANDLNPYAYTLTRGKLEAPISLELALKNTEAALIEIASKAPSIDLRRVPKWVRAFFHNETLREVVAAFQVLREHKDYFLLSCLLGILHHQRPGFLSYPSSHMVPYLRDRKYPFDNFPEMYDYRDLRSRLIAKIKRAYRRSNLPNSWTNHNYRVWNRESLYVPIPNGSINAVITSPPYFDTLSYGRDNRLRLWFLGETDWQKMDQRLSPRGNNYLNFMGAWFKEINRNLVPKGHCILIIGDYARNGTTKNTADLLCKLALNSTNNQFEMIDILSDPIPDNRRSRRKTKTTIIERILVLRRL
ncbi:MAG: DNA adenine methylase [Candidatus Marinimicrobia bacterium]|nr:DNA adenine methylase [Candidatus Neomarinimicrobiota bacterium]